MAERTLLLGYDVVHAWLGVLEGGSSTLDGMLWPEFFERLLDAVQWPSGKEVMASIYVFRFEERSFGLTLCSDV